MKPNEKLLFEAHAIGKGLKPTDFGRKFKMRNSVYTITGIKPRAQEYCVKVETGRGAKYVMSVSDVVRNLV